MNQNQINKID